MLSGHEWSLFGHHHCTLRVTSPCPGQRSTYRLQIPYTYAISLMTLSALLHWLTSQSIFIVKFDSFGQFREPTPVVLRNVLGYSCIGTIFTLTLAIVALRTVGGMGYRKFAARITTVGSCSAAISVACHLGSADPQEIIEKKVHWRDVQVAPSLGVRHLTFRAARVSRSL